MSTNWWAQKLGVQPQQTSTPAPAYVAPQPGQYAEPQQPMYPPSQQTQPSSPRCPGCGSGNYGGTTETRARCYDCGYPIEQSGSGVGRGIVGQGGQSSGPPIPSTQVPTGGFNPTTIIGHI